MNTTVPEWTVAVERRVRLCDLTHPPRFIFVRVNLKLARLPIPPHPRVDSSDWTR